MRFGATILDAEGLRLTPDETAFFRDANPFGFILFARNVEDPDQLRALCDDFREAVSREAPITIDQEGGRVQRIRAPMARNWSPPLDHVAQAGPENAARSMYLRYRLIAHELRSYGIDSNCAPMVDLAGPETHPFFKNRCYGSDPAAVAEIGRAVANGHLDGGVLPVVKHMPGHGQATIDSHFHPPHVADDLEALGNKDFAPFAALNDLPMGMTAHIVYEAITSDPATLSSDMMDLIRTEIGFDGLIMTDDLSMEALDGDYADRARRAIDAGVDVALLCNQSLADRIATAEAVDLMTDTAQARAEAALAARRTPDLLDIEASEAELSDLVDGQLYD